MSKHPIISYYKDTLKKDIPLILFVGREPNGKEGEKTINQIGKYDPKKCPRCLVWNKTLLLYGKLANNLSSKHKILADMKDHDSSPILFSNISGISQPAKAYKGKIRELEADNKEHIKNMMDQKIIERVQLVVAHDNLPIFNSLRESLEEICKKKEIPFIGLKYYLGNPRLRINDKDNGEHSDIIKFLRLKKPAQSNETVAKIIQDNYAEFLK